MGDRRLLTSLQRYKTFAAVGSAFATIVAAAALAASSTAAAAPPAKRTEAGRAFSTAVVRATQHGWRIAGVDVVEGNAPHGARRDTLHVDVILTRSATAQRLRLTFGEDGRRPTAMSRTRVAPPPARQRYRGAADLAGALASGGVRRVVFGCDSYLLELAGGVTVGVDSLDVYLLDQRVGKAEAPAALADALRELLDGGWHLVAATGARDRRAGEGSAVELIWSKKEQRYDRVLRAGLDRGGRLIGLEQQREPASEVYVQLSAAAAAALRSALGDDDVAAIGVAEGSAEAAETVTLELRSGKRHRIDDASFDY